MTGNQSTGSGAFSGGSGAQDGRDWGWMGNRGNWRGETFLRACGWPWLTYAKANGGDFKGVLAEAGKDKVLCRAKFGGLVHSFGLK